MPEHVFLPDEIEDKNPVRKELKAGYSLDNRKGSLATLNIRFRSHQRKSLMGGMGVVLFFLAMTLLLGHPLIWKGYLNGADLRVHLLWTQQFLNSQGAGTLYPQWASDANLGCGSPSFIFYPPLTFFLSGILSSLTREVLALLNVSALFGMFFSGLSMYGFSRIHLNRANAMLASVTYMALPYHLFDLYSRSAVAEHWAFVWLPLVCFFVIRMREKMGSSFIGLSFSYAGLVMTHLPTALLFSLFLVLFVFFTLSEERSKGLFLWRLTAISLGIGLSSLYLIPALFEQKYVNISDLNWFWMAFNNFLFSDRSVDPGANKWLSRVAMSALLPGGGGILIWSYQRYHLKEKPSACVLFFSTIIIASFAMMLPISRPFWEMTPLIKRVQFPWRLLLIVSFCSSLCVGLLADKATGVSFSLKGRINAFIGVVLLAFMGLSIWHSCFALSSPEYFSFELVNRLKERGWSIHAGLERSEMAKNYSFLFKDNDGLRDVPEYRPLGSVRRSLPIGFSEQKSAHSGTDESYIIIPPLGGLRQDKITDKEVILPHQMQTRSAIFEKGKGEIEIVRWEPERRVIKIISTERVKILVKTFFYPRWKAYLNEMPIAIVPHIQTGLIEGEIPEGKHIFELRFEAGPYRLMGILSSITSIGTILLILVVGKGLDLRSKEGKHTFHRKRKQE